MKKDSNECDLCKAYNIPNSETQKAIYEAHNNINLTVISNLEDLMKVLIFEL